MERVLQISGMAPKGTAKSSLYMLVLLSQVYALLN